VNKRGKYKNKTVLIIGIIFLIIGASVISANVNNISKNDILLTDDDFTVSLSLDDGLVGYWSFDEGTGNTVNDDSDGTNDGMIYGASWTSDAVIGNALEFDGIDDYVEVPSSSSLNFGKRDFSLLAWIKTDNSKSDDLQIIEKMDRIGGSAPYRGYYLRISHLTAHENTPEPCVSDGTNEVETWGDDVLTDNEWHFIAATFDRDDMLKLYIDGIFEIQIDITSVGDIDVDNPTYIGQQDNFDNQFIGQIDEVRIYNRVLSDSEIQELYDNPSGLNSVLMWGKIGSLNTDSNLIVLTADNIKVLKFSPFQFLQFRSGESIRISKSYLGIVLPSLVIGFFNANI
jgi:hypothetical protein